MSVLTPESFAAAYQFMLNNISSYLKREVSGLVNFENSAADRVIPYNAFDFSVMLAAATGKTKEDVLADIAFNERGE